jgi:hypothetical protein
MPFNVAALLIHTDDVPAAARFALKAAYEGPAGRRISELQTAARALHHEAGLDCIEAHDIVGLSPEAGCH